MKGVSARQLSTAHDYGLHAFMPFMQHFKTDGVIVQCNALDGSNPRLKIILGPQLSLAYPVQHSVNPCRFPIQIHPDRAILQWSRFRTTTVRPCSQKPL